MKPSSATRLVAALRKFVRWDEFPAIVRRAIVGITGATILLVGVALVFLPGPAFLVIPLGLAILATEFIWARRWLRKTRELMTRTKRKLTE